MTVSLINLRNYYVGLSTDTKPANGIIGNLFYEYDTRETYITYDGINWALYTRELKSVREAKNI